MPASSSSSKPTLRAVLESLPDQSACYTSLSSLTEWTNPFVSIMRYTDKFYSEIDLEGKIILHVIVSLLAHQTPLVHYSVIDVAFLRLLQFQVPLLFLLLLQKLFVSFSCKLYHCFLLLIIFENFYLVAGGKRLWIGVQDGLDYHFIALRLDAIKHAIGWKRASLPPRKDADALANRAIVSLLSKVICIVEVWVWRSLSFL